MYLNLYSKNFFSFHRIDKVVCTNHFESFSFYVAYEILCFLSKHFISIYVLMTKNIRNIKTPFFFSFVVKENLIVICIRCR